MKKTKVTTTSWDASEHLTTTEEMVAYLEAAFEDGDTAVISAALGDIARAKGMTEISEKTGLGRTSLYKALSPGGHPEFETVVKVMKALDLELQVVPS
jgi:probable addiction module antidote protein